MKKENKKLLQELHVKHTKSLYPSLPDYAIPNEKFSEASANELTKTICKFITYLGGQAERINTMGVYKDNRKVVTDVLGGKRTIGSGQWIKSGSTPGSADISATVNGKSIKIEVKFGKDRMSDAQWKYKEMIERAGGVYIIARDFDSFLEEFDVKVMLKSKNTTSI